jgi:hypothetical protein
LKLDRSSFDGGFDGGIVTLREEESSVLQEQKQ